MIKVFYWQYEQLDMLGGVPVNHYHSGFIKALSELDVPDGADIQEGVFLTLSELEQREREAFDAGRASYMEAACHESDTDYYRVMEWETFDDYKKSRWER